MADLRKLGASDVRLSPVAFGAWAIGGLMWGGADAKDAVKAVRASYDLGATTIDTAPVYGLGQSERLIGQAMAGIPRDSYQLCTKYGLSWYSDKGSYYFTARTPEGESAKLYKYAGKERVIEECEESLKRLKTDYIDLYQIHWPDPKTPIGETMEAVNQLLTEGKIRAAGVCNFTAAQTAEAMAFAPVVSNQVPYSMINRAIEEDAIPQALEKGLGTLAYSPLQRGLLTGKVKPDISFSAGDTRKVNPFFKKENIKRANAVLEKIKPIAEAHKATLAQIAIYWTMHRPGIACALVGARNERQVKDNLKALELKLSEDELERIDQATRSFQLA